jgi:hypothetical protein
MKKKDSLPWSHSHNPDKEETSKDAADSMIPHAPNQRQRVWEFIHGRGGFGATCDEVEMRLEMLHGSASTRLLELEHLGRVETAGAKRLTRSNREAMVYFAIEPDDWTDKRPNWPTPEYDSMPQRLKARIASLENRIRELNENRTCAHCGRSF